MIFLILLIFQQIVVIVLTLGLFIMSIYDVIFTRRTGGDPTVHVDMSATDATTYNNPGFRDRPKNGIDYYSIKFSFLKLIN